ncbi:MAG: nucleoside-diphosphate kinase [Clostridiales bacterium]|jgi:nucleoside-diphosphate kinase|nr:nucleoside-diphosphate kinase [Clostridiales bacterium]MDN5297855.1 nucleoside-diphosphate kinase [Clostridiales bacterium]
MAQLEKTLVILKPDAVKRGLIGEIIKRYEAKQLTITKMMMLTPSRDTLAKHYAEHEGKSFFENLLAFMMSGDVVVMTITGPNAVAQVRKINGATKFLDAEMGTIRGDFGVDLTANLVHGSDSPESAKREIDIWFGL